LKGRGGAEERAWGDKRAREQFQAKSGGDKGGEAVKWGPTLWVRMTEEQKVDKSKGYF